MSQTSGSAKTSTLREYVDSLLVTVILALFGTTFLLQAFKIPSSSMEETLLVGDHLLVNKFIFAGPPDDGGSLLPYRAVRRGDIVVFKYPFPPYTHFVKRVIGLPGDRLKIVRQQVYVNGEPLAEPYKVHRRRSFAGHFQDNFPSRDTDFLYALEPEWAAEVAAWTSGDELLIPPDKYFVLGDNRDNSQDSRYWGFVNRKNIIGRPLLIYWSFDASQHRARPSSRRNRMAAAWDTFIHFFSRTRWKRLLHMVR
ncbi:MAG: signal peptidase I [Terriglobia bacterium]